MCVNDYVDNQDFCSKSVKWSLTLVLTPVIQATQEAEIRRITVQSQPRETVYETPS
jgi:hypothetical protein